MSRKTHLLVFCCLHLNHITTLSRTSAPQTSLSTRLWVYLHLRITTSAPQTSLSTRLWVYLHLRITTLAPSAAPLHHKRVERLVCGCTFVFASPPSAAPLHHNPVRLLLCMS